MCNIRRYYRLRELYEADFHKPGIVGSGRVWANAWDVFFARRLEVIAVAGLMWVSWCAFGWAGFFRAFSMSLHFQIRRPRAVSVDWVRGLRQPANLPTENSRPLIPTRCPVWCAPTWEIWRHQLVISKVAGSHRLKPVPSILVLSNFKYFFKLRERQSPLLARQPTAVDIRKRDRVACVLTPSIPAGRCVSVLRVAQSRFPTYHLSCGSSS